MAGTEGKVSTSPRDTNGDSPRTPEVTEIARLVLIISGIGILAIAAAVLSGGILAGADAFERNTTLVFTALLPLLGTWVGTVLAYYFSRKNFETASQSVERMVTLTTEQRLAQTAVNDQMLR